MDRAELNGDIVPAKSPGYDFADFRGGREFELLLTERLWEIGDIVGVLKAWEATQVRAVYLGGKAMEWFSQKTSIAGTQISNWVLVLAALVVIWIIYRSAT
ncbi:hypothetical protein SAMN05443247_03869 [Bradyrhizobium erythrophlei]|nr:hypothetical protein SAMN05443247_03869 [Bradyrhizobium erythrophlei]